MSNVNKYLAFTFFVGLFNTVNAVELVNRPYVPKVEPQKTQPSTNLTVQKSTAAIRTTGQPEPQAASATQAPVSVSAVPTPVAAPAQQWSLKVTDVNYAGAILRWAEGAGYQVRWDASKHFYIEAENTFSGTFEDAVTSVLANPAVAFSSYPLEVCFYPNTPPLARITRRGEQVKECN